MDYKSSGVDIDAGNKAVNLIKNNVKKTFNSNVLNSLGSFAAMYELPKLKNPVLVSCTDGVGTKLKIAIDEGINDTVGIDLVAMSVNDLICCGAKPLFFLDYIACHKNVPEQIKEIVDGIVEGCEQSECALIGGEMAEMNDLYKDGDYDLAGFAVGVVEKDERIDGSKIAPGNYVYGLASSGVHSNGYSLLRKVLTKDVCEKYGLSAKDLLVPTKIYVKEILGLVSQKCVNGIAHITGGGLAENLERILPEGVNIKINKSKIKTPKIFEIIKEAGSIKETEMFRVFNMGVGMVVITSKELPESEDITLLGMVEAGSKGVTVV
jgi:phosphoribosylformylglycinamidine cyclo-ligase